MSELNHLLVVEALADHHIRTEKIIIRWLTGLDICHMHNDLRLVVIVHVIELHAVYAENRPDAGVAYDGQRRDRIKLHRGHPEFDCRT